MRSTRAFHRDVAVGETRVFDLHAEHPAADDQSKSKQDAKRSGTAAFIGSAIHVGKFLEILRRGAGASAGYV